MVRLIPMQDRFAGKVGSLANKQWWKLEGVFLPKLPGDFLETRWRLEDGTVVRKVDDYVAPFRQILIEGPSEQAVAQQVRSALPVMSLADALQARAQAQGVEAIVDSVFRVGLVAPAEFEASAFEVLRAAAGDGDPMVAAAAFRASAYTAWPEWHSIAEDRIGAGEDVRVLDAARALLAALDRQGA